MKALVMNCSPVRNGATAEIVKIVSENLKENVMSEVYALMILRLISVKVAEPATIQQNVFSRMMLIR